MKIKPTNQTAPFPSTTQLYGRNDGKHGIDTLPACVVKANIDLLVKYRLLSLLIKLREGPLGQRLDSLPDTLKVDMTAPEYRLVATKDGYSWPSAKSRAIQAFLGKK